MAEVGTHAGVTWASVQDRPMSVWLPASGPVVLQLALTYSVEGPVHLELLQGPAGSIWDANEAFYVETPRQMLLRLTTDTADSPTFDRRPDISSSRCHWPASRASNDGGPGARSATLCPSPRGSRRSLAEL